MKTPLCAKEKSEHENARKFRHPGSGSSAKPSHGAHRS